MLTSRLGRAMVGAAVLLMPAAPLVYALTHPLIVGPATESTVSVKAVLDGDTFMDDRGRRYRMVGINAPEIPHPEHGKNRGDPGGMESKRYLADLILGREVTVVKSDKDRYGRNVVLVFEQSLGDEPVNLRMVRAGHARVHYLNLAPSWFDTQAFAALAQTAGGSEAAAALQLSKDTSIVIKAGDRVYFTVGQQDQTFTVNTNGSIYVKGLGELVLVGLTVQEARDTFGARLREKKIKADYDVFFVPTVPAPPKVSLLGDLARPGFYQAQTLLELMTVAAVNSATVGDAIVRDSETVLATVNVKALMLGEVEDVPLPSNSVVFLTSAKGAMKWVNVYGEVVKPGPVQTISALGAIGSAFGLRENAARNRIQIHTPDGQTVIFDYDKIAKGEGSDISIPEGTVVYVPAKGTVMVSGAVSRPGWVYADGAREALKNAGWPTEHAQLDRAIYKSVEGEESRVDLSDIIVSGQGDFQMQTGDELILTTPPMPAVEVLGWVEREGVYHETTVFGCIALAAPKAGALTSVTVHDVRAGDTAGETIPLIDLRRPAWSDLRIKVERLPFIQISGAVTVPGIYHATNLPDLIAKAFGLTPEAELSGLAFYDTYGRQTALPADGTFPFDGQVRVPAKVVPVPGDLVNEVDSNVLVTGYGIKTCVLPPGDLRQLILKAGFTPGKSGLNIRVYRTDPDSRRTYGDRRGKFVLNRNIDLVLFGRQTFVCQAGDAVYLEEKNDPLGWMTRIVSFLRTMSGASTTIVNTGGGD